MKGRRALHAANAPETREHAAIRRDHQPVDDGIALLLVGVVLLEGQQVIAQLAFQQVRRQAGDDLVAERLALDHESRDFFIELLEHHRGLDLLAGAVGVITDPQATQVGGVAGERQQEQASGKKSMHRTPPKESQRDDYRSFAATPQPAGLTADAQCDASVAFAKQKTKGPAEARPSRIWWERRRIELPAFPPALTM